MTSGAAQKYETLSWDEIANFPIGQIAHKNSLLFLWVPVPLSMKEVPQIVAHWGYIGKTKIFWRKIGRYGTGWWFRGDVEELWVLKKGKLPCLRCQQRNVLVQDGIDQVIGWIERQTSKHSEKPAEARMLIDQALQPFPELAKSKIELFARERVHGWHAWGHGVDKPDIDLIYP